MTQQQSKQRGYILILMLVVSAAFLAIGISLAGLVSDRYKSSKRTTYVENAVLAADAGITDTLNRILMQDSFTGYSTPKQFYSTTTKGKAEYTTTVAYNDTTKLYTIRSTGYTYTRQTDAVPANTKTVEVTGSLGGQSVQARVAAGPGGLAVGTNGSIGGKNIWVNGKVIVAGGLIGVTGFLIFGPFADVSMNVANAGCGDATNYPAPCTGPFPGSGEPIQYSGGGIYGTVCANNQTTSAGIFPGQSGQGLIGGCSAPPIMMPQFDRKGLYDSMTTSRSGFYCDGYWWSNPLASHLNGNTIFNGNIFLVPAFLGNCNIAITGNVYIRGSLFMNGYALGMYTSDNWPDGTPMTTPPIVLVEGTITMAQTWSSYIYANKYGVTPIFISFNSNNVACNSNPSCTELSSSDLYNSVNRTTINIVGDVGASGSVFYSYFGTVSVGPYGTVGGLAGQRILVSSNGGLTSFANGGLNRFSFPVGDAFGGRVKIPVWNIVTYRQIF